jgi:hypothetical protein
MPHSVAKNILQGGNCLTRQWPWSIADNYGSKRICCFSVKKKGLCLIRKPPVGKKTPQAVDSL